jgi:lipopolysaccharide export LptBFGC system permease protein LptF
MRHGLVWRGRLIRLVNGVAICKVIAVSVSGSLLHRLYEGMADDGWALGRTLLSSGVATVFATVIFVWPPLHQLRRIGDVEKHIPLLIICLLPQALLNSVPMGLLSGILIGLRGRVLTQPARRRIVWLMAGATLVMLPTTGWLLPAANQAFRELTFVYSLPQDLHVAAASGLPLARGMNERTLVELALMKKPFQVNQRVALACAPLATGLLALALALGCPRVLRSWAAALAASVVISFSYLALAMWTTPYGPLASGGSPVSWLPNALCLCLACGVYATPKGSATPPLAER